MDNWTRFTLRRQSRLRSADISAADRARAVYTRCRVKTSRQTNLVKRRAARYGVKLPVVVSLSLSQCI